MNRCLPVFILALISLFTGPAFAQTEISTVMDWSNGRFEVSAHRPLAPGMSPDDHPRALRLIENELWPLVESEIGRLLWDRNGTIANLTGNGPEFLSEIRSLALSKEWSRLSLDRKFIDTLYSGNLRDAIFSRFPAEGIAVLAEIPAGWIPVPEDPWTGIVIYAPSGLPVRGSNRLADPVPAFRARILSSELSVLFDPGIHGAQSLNYRTLDRGNEIDAIVGRRPYRAMARALYGQYPCDIILSEDDTLRIMASQSGRRALAEGQISILLDSWP